MEETATTPSPSLQELAIRRHYNTLLSLISSPVQLAELLFSDGIIRRETNERVTSEEDEDHAKRILLDAVQCALAQTSDQEEVMSSFCSTLEKVGVRSEYYGQPFYIGKIKAFIAGEYNCVKATVI